MQGLYIHIPFCRKACHYCDFHFSTSLRHKKELLAALQKEIALQKNYLPPQPISSVYFGGGTPSLLNEDELNSILQTLHAHFSVESGAEITLEANPDDISAEKVKQLKMAGINRLSIGVQSFFEEDLAWMNRAHTAAQAAACIDIALQSGIENITADLIYGYPLLSDDKWKENINRMLSSGIKHLSAYSLTVEPKTALAHRIKTGQDIPPPSGQAARHFEMLMDAIAAAGWEQYEISNYCKPGNYARHNTGYWKNQPYLGIGPSAHSYNGKTRQWNIANNAAYIKALDENHLLAEIEQLSVANRFNEYILTGLRTQWGIDSNYITGAFGKHFAIQLQNAINIFIFQGHVLSAEGRYSLSRSGKLLADYITAALFAETD